MTQKNLLSQLLKAPELAIESLNLVYVDNGKMPISRHRKGKGFVYTYKQKPLKDKNELERITSLVLPPAWEDVKITHLQNGHLQAVGKDLKNRKQYRYHPTWVKIRNQTKFYKMSLFGKKLPVIREQVEKDLAQKQWSKSKVVALIVKLMDETHIRIGNEQYAKRNKSYGLSTLRKKHVEIFKNNIKFEFVGKKGKKHSVTVRNKKLIRLISRCEDIPGWELFQYYDEDGDKQSVDSSMVNEYLHEISGEFFTAKDFRTWAASVIFFDTLLDQGTAETQKETKQNLLEGFDAAAAALGNTRNVCRKYYVHPVLVSKYEDGSIEKWFDKAQKTDSEQEHFSTSEMVILDLFEQYTPKF
ncbi:DNA topoisomerase IB [Zobellia sp. B3R18]|uniref:DNA topoisomerase IB n=1 Tax=Zobellia sp. B3R18 TaxID=2841568 RepID=UPI001C06E3CC|nr:DNA topoisomerase IB [Zobellia sp. B3R18]MBU2975527.1 DNA topoisomerase IB [Zobellia sp. B3R18]